MSREASEAVKSLLPEYANGDLASVCSWPDEVSHRAGWRWSSPLHYVDTPDFRCNYDYCRMFGSSHNFFHLVRIFDMWIICCPPQQITFFR